MRGLFSDIRAWILLLFVLRLFGITNPPLEVSHNWRQTTVTMVSRNFLEADANILYPRIDIGGEKAGITGMEFPLLNWLIFIVSKVFGYDHWYGRLINLLVSSAGLWFFYRLCEKYFSARSAFYATIILGFSVWLTFSRKIMPDTFSVSLVVAGLYYGSEFIERKRRMRSFVLYFFLTLAGVLSKLPSGFLLVLLLPLFARKECGSRERILISAATLVAAGVVSLYYFYWVPALNSRFGFTHFFMGKGFSQGLTDTLTHMPEFADKFILQAMGYSGFILFVTGIVIAVRKRNKPLLIVFVSGLAGFVVVILKAGFAFYHHDYYIIPFVPVMSLVAGWALDNMKPWLVYFGLAAVICEAVPRKNTDFYIKEENLAIMKLEGHLDSVGGREELILINSGNVPSPMYFAHRKGWVAGNAELSDRSFISTLKEKGLRHIVVLKRAFGSDLRLPYHVEIDNADFTIYRP